MLIGVVMHLDRVGDLLLVIGPAAALAVRLVAWGSVLCVVLLLGTFALLLLSTLTLIWLSEFWHWCLDQFDKVPEPYDFWNDLRSIEDECYDPIIREGTN